MGASLFVIAHPAFPKHHPFRERRQLPNVSYRGLLRRKRTVRSPPVFTNLRDGLAAEIALAKAAILKGVDASMFIAEMRAWAERRGTLLAEAERAFKLPTPTNLRHADLGNTYRQRVGRLTDAFEDDALRSQAFERIRSLIETVVLKPENRVLAIYLRGEFASMLELCVCPKTQKASSGVSGEALQIKMVAGTGFEPVTFRL